MYIALTGTPGTGKTSAAKILASRGYAVITVEELAKKHGALDEGSMEVDVEALADAVQQPADTIILEGHLAHFVPAATCIVLRCHPDIVRNRLEARGYDAEKVRQNVEAEAIDLILSETMDCCPEVFEVDASNISPEELADAIETIIKGKGDKFPPGRVDWSQAVMDWY